MAPSSRIRGRPAGAQQPLRTVQFGGITKVKKCNAQLPCNVKKTAALEDHLEEKKKPIAPRTAKRRRDSIDSEVEIEVVAGKHGPTKKVKFQQPTPPRSPVLQELSQSQPLSPRRKAEYKRIETPGAELPETITELISLHKIFVRALSLYYAHRGSRTAVPLSTLLPSMTRLWKKATVSQKDLARMLAIWELQDSEQQFKGPVDHQKGPFRLVTAGVGSNASTSVEFAWTEGKQTFNEIGLQKKYEDAVRLTYFATHLDDKSFVFGSAADFPHLTPIVGSQTAAKQEKVNAIRDDILGLRAKVAAKTSQSPGPVTQPDLSKLSLSDGNESALSKKDAALKARTLSLFDRVRAKQLATSSFPSDASSLLRQRAVGRLPDIVNILRLKQSQKLSSHLSTSAFYSDMDANPNDRLRTMMKVAFSLDTLVTEIKDSLIVPIGADEVRECINILGREIPDTWCSVHDSGGVKCVTLQGEGRSGIEMKREAESILAAKAL